MEILNSVLKPASLTHIDSKDLAQLAKSKIRQNGKYQNAGLSLAATMETFKFVFAKTQHFTGVEWVQHKYVNATTAAL